MNCRGVVYYVSSNYPVTNILNYFIVIFMTFETREWQLLPEIQRVGSIYQIQKKIKKEKILLQKRGRDNPVNFGEIHSLLNRFEVFSINYLCQYFLTFLETKTVPKVTVLGVTNSTARKCKQNTTKWNKIIWSVSPRGLFSTLPNIYDRALLWC